MYEVCLKSNETGAVKFFVTTALQSTIITSKVVPLGSHTLLEMLLPLLVAMLEIFMWKCPQLVCHDLLHVVRSSKMTTFEMEFEFQEKEEVARTQIRRVWGLRNHWNTLLLLEVLQLQKLEVLAFSTSSFSLHWFLMQSLQLFILMFFRSFLISSSLLFLGLPSDLVDMVFHSYTFFTILSSGMRCTCPDQANFVL